MIDTASSPVVAVVTPYYLEDAEKLVRCIRSVVNQTYENVLHFLVADGFPRADLIARYPSLRHITLPNKHGDNGDTPRGIGALCALNEGASIACFLDADNFYETDHVTSVVDAFGAVGGDAVFSERTIMPCGYPDLRIIDPEDEKGAHVDTSCISLSASAAFLWPSWAMIPMALSPIGDRIMTSLIQHHHLRCTRTRRRTVVFESNYRHHFQLARLPAPHLPHEPDMAKLRQAYDPAESFDRLRVGIRV
jgi:glycosyltransferase involved in cell wall biosynthesis